MLLPVCQQVSLGHRDFTGRTTQPWCILCAGFFLIHFLANFFSFPIPSTAEEKRELVRSLKESIKRGIKARSNATGLSAAAPGRSRSFRRNNNSGSGPAFLRASTGDSVLRRSFSHNPEEAQTRRNSLIQGDLIPGGVASAYQEGRENRTSGPLPSPPSQGQQLTAKRKANFMAPVTVGDMGSF